MGIHDQITEQQRERYARQIVLPAMGEAGQKKLLDASVLVVGVGGLGSPISLYLAAVGIGRLGLVDPDVVDLSNLQRQVLYRTPEVGQPKLERARQTLNAMNPELVVETYETRFQAHNALEIIHGYDVVIDGTDNFPSKYLLNDACVLSGKPLIQAGVACYEGQMMVIKPGEGPCYRCVHPDPPIEGAIPSSRETGILGTVPGVMGILQATEAIKLITGCGPSLVGQLLLYDAIEMEFRRVRISRDPDCAICGGSPTIKELEDLQLPSC